VAPHEYQSGTFSVSNLGMAVGGGSPRVVPALFDPTKDNQDTPAIKTVMTAQLTVGGSSRGG
jgi:hypothetical protein